jgi:hypothetical protein
MPTLTPASSDSPMILSVLRFMIFAHGHPEASQDQTTAPTPGTFVPRESVLT